MINSSPTIQDALGKEECQYPHAPLRSISSISFFFLRSLCQLFAFFLIFNKSVAGKDRRDHKYFLFPAVAAFLSSVPVRKKMKMDGWVKAPFLLIVSGYRGRGSLSGIHDYAPPRGSAPGLNAVASLCRSRALHCQTCGRWTRCAAVQVKCAATSAALAESEAGDAEDERAKPNQRKPSRNSRNQRTHKKKHQKCPLRVCTCIYLHKEINKYRLIHMYLQINKKITKCKNVRGQKCVKVLFFCSRITERASCLLASKSFSFSPIVRAVRNKQTHLPPPAAAHQPAPGPWSLALSLQLQLRFPLRLAQRCCGGRVGQVLR